MMFVTFLFFFIAKNNIQFKSVIQIYLNWKHSIQICWIYSISHIAFLTLELAQMQRTLAKLTLICGSRRQWNGALANERGYNWDGTSHRYIQLCTAQVICRPTGLKSSIRKPSPFIASFKTKATSRGEERKIKTHFLRLPLNRGDILI